MATLKEQMQERLDQRPDKHTIAWWESQLSEVLKGYRGLSHACSLVLADMEDHVATVKELKTRLDAQGKDLQDAKVAIGELTERMEKAREVYSELKKKVGP